MTIEINIFFNLLNKFIYIEIDIGSVSSEFVYC